MSYPFKIKSTYSFEVYPDTVIGNNYTNVTVLGIVDYQTALSMGVDIDAIHVNVFPLLPQGLPDDPQATEYLKIRTSSNIETVIGLNWIRENTIEEVESLRAVVTVEGVTSLDLPKILLAIQQNGYNNVSGILQ